MGNEWGMVMNKQTSNLVEIVKLRQKVCGLNGKIAGMYDLLNMSEDWISEEQRHGLYMEAQSLEGFFAMKIEEIEEEIKKLRQGE
jgi:hypothetical protein